MAAVKDTGTATRSSNTQSPRQRRGTTVQTGAVVERSEVRGSQLWLLPQVTPPNPSQAAGGAVSSASFPLWRGCGLLHRPPPSELTVCEGRRQQLHRSTTLTRPPWWGGGGCGRGLGQQTDGFSLRSSQVPAHLVMTAAPPASAPPHP